MKATLQVALCVAFCPSVYFFACRLWLQLSRIRIRCIAPRAASQELTCKSFCFPLQPAPASVAFPSLRLAFQYASMSTGRFFRFPEFASVISAFLRSVRRSLLSKFPLLSPKAEPQHSSCLHY